MTTRSTCASRGLAPRRLAAAMAGVSLLAPLVACGGGSTGKSDGPLKVIVSTQHDLTMMGPETADHFDLWSSCAEDLDVEIAAGQEVPQAMASGSADVGITSPNSFIAAISEGLEAKIVGSSMPKWDQYAIVTNESDAAEFKVLKGSTFGISNFGSAGHFATEAIADSLDWTKRDYKLVTLGGLDGLRAGLKSGAIDAFLWSGAPAYTLESEGTARVLGSVSELVGPNAMTVYGVTNEAMETRPEDVKALMECSYRAVETAQSDAELTRRMLVEVWKYQPDVADKMIEVEVPSLSTDGAISDDMIQGMLKATHATVDRSDSLTMNDLKAMYVPWSSL